MPQIKTTTYWGLTILVLTTVAASRATPGQALQRIVRSGAIDFPSREASKSILGATRLSRSFRGRAQFATCREYHEPPGLSFLSDKKYRIFFLDRILHYKLTLVWSIELACYASSLWRIVRFFFACTVSKRGCSAALDAPGTPRIPSPTRIMHVSTDNEARCLPGI